MKIAHSYLLLLFLGLFFACDSDDSQDLQSVDNTGTIADLLEADPNFSDLVVALNRANLLQGFDGSDPYTFFAPSNEALAEYVTAAGFETVFQIPEESLRLLFLHHSVAEVVEANFGPGYLESQERYQETSILQQLFFDPLAGGIVNDSTTVVNTQSASNGVLYQIDQVIEQISMADLIYSNPELSIFVEALELAAINGPNYRSSLDNPFSTSNTTFAPSNAAMEAGLEFLGYVELSDVPVNTLRSILNQHLVQDLTVHGADLADAEPLQTVNDEFLIPNAPDGIIDATGTTAQILTADIQAANGVVHIVDKLLLPENVAITVSPSITDYVQAEPSLSLFYEALTLTGLDEMFDDTDQDYTVLMPSNFVINFYLDGQDLDDVPLAELEQLILNHTFLGEIGSEDFSTGFRHTLAVANTNGSPLSVYVDTEGENGITFNGMSYLQETDIELDNGLGHMIHRILAVPDVYSVVANNPLLEGLKEAMNQDNLPAFSFILGTNYNEQPAPFTLFAPTDPAFDSLLIELGLESLDEIPPTELTLALNTHLLLGQNLTSEEFVSGPLTTSGDEVQLNTGAGTLTDLNGRTANFGVTDIQTDNGIIHLIDTVLLGEQ